MKVKHVPENQRSFTYSGIKKLTTKKFEMQPGGRKREAKEKRNFWENE